MRALRKLCASCGLANASMRARIGMMPWQEFNVLRTDIVKVRPAYNKVKKQTALEIRWRKFGYRNLKIIVKRSLVDMRESC